MFNFEQTSEKKSDNLDLSEISQNLEDLEFYPAYLSCITILIEFLESKITLTTEAHILLGTKSQ